MAMAHPPPSVTSVPKITPARLTPAFTPVNTNITLGCTAVGKTYTHLAGYLVFNPVTVTTAGYSNSLVFDVAEGAGAVPIVVGIYSNVAQVPFQLLAQSAPQTTATGWMTFPVTTYLSPGQYWLGVSSNCYMWCDSTATTFIYNKEYAYSNVMPPLMAIDNNWNNVPFIGRSMTLYMNFAPIGRSPTYTPTATFTGTQTPTTTPYPWPPHGSTFKTPPMGWYDYVAIRPEQESETNMESFGNAMVTTGLAAAGYVYLVMDEGWEMPSRVNGHLVPDTTRFPNGLGPVISYIHSHGLKIGVYRSNGNTSCIAGYPGGYGYETIDANDFASWGIDFVKLDYCDPSVDFFSPFLAFANAVEATGKIIYLESNSRQFYGPMFWVYDQNRNNNDLTGTWASTQYAVTWNSKYAFQSQPGSFNDPMEMIDDPEWDTSTQTESSSRFSLWCMMNAPLFTTNDLRTATTAAISILTNTELIGIDQDPICNQAVTASTSDSGNCIVFSKVLTGTNTRAVALTNWDSTSQSMTVTFSNCGVPAGTYAVRDLWAHQKLGKFLNSYTCTVASHATTMLKIIPHNK